MATNKRMGDRRVRSFTVSKPTLHPKGYTVYCVRAKIFDLEQSEALQEVVIWKRYNDFKKLYTFLNTLHKKLHRRDEFPDFARAKLFGRFDETVIEERRVSAENLLNFIATQPHLVRSANFQKFFEGGETIDLNSELDALRHSDMLTPHRLRLANQMAADSTSTDSNEMGQQERNRFNDDETGPLSDARLAHLGGVWQFRREPDNVSLNSQEDDDIANLTDESALSTPLPDADITFFDPLQPLPGEDQNEASDKSNDRLSNTWLLSAMTVCASLEGEGHSVSHDRNSDLTDGGHMERSQNSGAKLFSIGGPPSSQSEVTSCRDSQHTPPPLVLPSSGGSERTPPNTLSSPALIAKSIAGKAGLTPPSPRKSPAVTPSHSSSSLKGMDRSPSKTRLVVEKGDYILQAANQICLAQENEVNGDYQLAFDFYKSGVEMLLMGVQEDDNKTRRDAVRRKTAYYLMKAEDIYKRHLTNASEHGDRWAADSRFSPSVEVDPRVTFMRGSVTALSNYRVLGVVNKVLLVLDKITEETYIIKVLHKSCTPWTNSNRRAVVPTACPYMVRLHQYFETDNAIYLLLEHASGGRLWDYISAYMSGSRNNSQADILDIVQMDAQVNGENTLNVYSGQHCAQSENDQATDELVVKSSSSRESDVVTDKNNDCSASYAAIFTNTQSDSTPIDCVRFVSHGTVVEENTSRSTANNDGSNLDSFDKDFSDVKVHSDTPRDILYKDSDDQSEENTVSTMESIDNGARRENSGTRKTSLQFFSINSVDSEEAVSMLSDSSKRDHIDSIPEDSEIPTFPPPDVATHPDAVVDSAKQLIQSVEEMLTQDDSQSCTDEDEDVFTDKSKTLHANNAAFCSSTPIKNLGQENSKLPELNMATKGIQSKQSECDNEDVRSDAGKEKKTIADGRISSPAHRSVLFARGTSMDRSDESDLKPRRKRTMSNVFSQLDVDADRYTTGLHIPESCIAQWAAEMVTALSTLHAQGLVCGDLRPDNILLGPRGHILLTYFSRWTNVDRDISEQAIDQMYAAPEIKWLERVGPASDWWSFGALLYELLTGKTLCSCHPSGINSHSQLYLPEHVSPEAASLLQELLHYNAKERLGSGLNGEEDIRLHPFFASINWCSLLG